MRLVNSDDKTCSGLNSFARASNIFRPAQRKFVYIGNYEVLEIDPLTSKTLLLTFDKDSLHQDLLTKPVELSIGKVPLFHGTELTYLGMNRMLVSNDSSSDVFRISRTQESVFLAPLGRHHWGQTAPRGHFFYAGHDRVGRFSSNSTFALFDFDRNAASLSELPSVQSHVSNIDPFASQSTLLVPLPGDVWLAFEYRTGFYQSFHCATDSLGVFSTCTLLNSGSLTKGYSCVHEKEVSCAEMSRVGCVQSKRCGYCLSTKTCMPGTERGPTDGNRCDSETGNAWIFTTNEFTKNFLLLGSSLVMDVEQSSGKYNIWQLDRNPADSKCRMLSDSVASGFLQNAIDHIIQTTEDGILDFDPATGKFRLATCNEAAIVKSGSMQCETWADGSWPVLKNRKIAVLISGSAEQPLLLDYNPSNGDYRVWTLATKVQFEAGSPLMRATPMAQGSVPGLVESDVTVVPGFGFMVLAHQSVTSTTYFYEMIGGRLMELVKPISKGLQVVVVDGEKRIVQSRYVSLGNTTLLEFNPRGSWQYLECFPNTVSNDVFNIYAPIHCEPHSSGSAVPPRCASRGTKDECTANPSCGWCSSVARCLGGYDLGACSREESCPIAAWNYAGGEENIGEIVEVPQAPEPQLANCVASTSCQSCVSNPSCGWHGPTRTCVNGGPKGPKDLTQYPVVVRGDWNYFYCTGVDGCGLKTSCSECASATYCGYCPTTKTCLTASTAGPIFDTCPGQFFFNKRECPAF